MIEVVYNLKGDLMVLGDMYPKFTLSIPNLDFFDDDPSMGKVTVALNLISDSLRVMSPLNSGTKGSQ